MLTLRRRQSAKPLGRRLVAEHTQGVTRNSEAAQVLGRIMMLPIAVLREILNYLDTKLLDHDASVFDIAVGFRHWTGTQRMQNSIRLRRRLGQTGWQIRHRDFEYLDSENDNGYENNWWQE